MPGSVLLTLTASAVALLLPVGFGLLRAQRPTHAARHAGTPQVRVGGPAVAVGAGGAASALLLGAAPPVVVANALVLAGAVVVQARSNGSWRMLGVVAWALLVTATVAFLAWLGLQVLGVADIAATVGGAVAWLLLGLAATRIRPHAREMVARSSRREPVAEQAAAVRPPPVGWLVTGAASLALVVAFGVGAALAPDEQPSQAAEEDGSSQSRSGADPERSPSVSPSPDRPSSTPTETGTPGGRAPGQSAPSPGPEPATAPQGDTGAPERQPEAPQPTKTPGYAKDKPNRPADAPTPGSGRRGSS